jgi:hypothetical protein
MGKKNGVQAMVKVCHPIEFHGGAEGDRTPGLMNAIHALSQLSYSPTAQFLR